MTARKAVQTANPATFNLAAFLGRFQPPTVKARLFRRGDLLGEIDRLDREIDNVEKLGDAAAENQSVADGGGLDALVLQRNEMVRELEDSAEEFEFQALSALHTLAASKKLGFEPDQKLTEDEGLLLRFGEMAETCISHPGITAEAFHGLRVVIGDTAVGHLVREWLAVQGLGDPDAPFSQRASHTPTTAES